jgi:RNA polymerase sigma-70 factor (ECF subfamily)
MASAAESRTSPSLLGRLRQSPTDQAAWEEFVERYGPRIYGWCRHWGLQDADAEDVAQDVLVRLAEKMRTFHYDPAGSFRGWLKTLAHHAWYDFVRRRQRAGCGSGDTAVLDRLQSVEAREDLVQRLGEEFDRELLDEAQARVRLHVSARVWDAFRLLALEGWSGARAAAWLNMSVAAAFVARSKVQRLIRQEVRRLEGQGPESPEGLP